LQVKRRDGDRSAAHEAELQHGDLMTMEGLHQLFYVHSVFPGDSMGHGDHPQCQGERINLTFRTITKHLDGSSECRGLACPLSGAGAPAVAAAVSAPPGAGVD
jgi:hypothetical protein